MSEAIKDKEVYSELLFQDHIISALIEKHPLEEMMSLMSRAEGIDPLLNPSLYMENATKFHQDQSIVRILLEAQQKIKVLKSEMKA